MDNLTRDERATALFYSQNYRSVNCAYFGRFGQIKGGAWGYLECITTTVLCQ